MIGGAQGDEWPGADKIPCGGVRAEISPAQNRRQEAKPGRVSALELSQHRHGLLLGREPLLRDETRPIWTRTAWWVRMLQTQSASWPQAEQMTVSPAP